MNSPITQSKDTFLIGFNIHLLAFYLPKNVIKSKDKIRISITTKPENIKQHFKIKGKKMCKSNYVFSLNITNQTKRIVMVFRKKNFLNEDPIIASTIIYTSSLPKIKRELSHPINTQVKNYNIYYPISKQMREQQVNGFEETKKEDIKRKVLGQMQVQFTFNSPYKNIKVDNNKKDKSKIIKHKKDDMKKDYAKFNNSSSIFLY